MKVGETCDLRLKLHLLFRLCSEFTSEKSPFFEIDLSNQSIFDDISFSTDCFSIEISCINIEA